MKKRIAVLLLIVYMLTLTACGGGQNEAPQVCVSVSSLGLENISNGERDIMELDGTRAGVKVLNDKNDEISSAINIALEELVDHYFIEIDETKSKAQEFAQYLADEGLDPVMFALDFDVIDSYVSGNVLSIVFEKYVYYGGAHGGSERFAANFDLTDGHRLTWDEIAGDGDALRNKVHNYIAGGIKGGKYDQHYFFDNYEEYLDASLQDYTWYIADGNLKVIYNQYEIAPYAAGIIEFAMPLSDIEGLKLQADADTMTEGSLTVQYLKDAKDPNIISTEGSEALPEEERILLTAEGDVSNIKLYNAVYYDDELTADGDVSSIQLYNTVDYDDEQLTLYATSLYASCSYLQDKESLELNYLVPEIVPDLIISYDKAGETKYYVIIQSGKDGSLSLQTPDEISFELIVR